MLCLASFAATSPYDLNRPVGWGTVKQSITGGEGGTCVTVTSASDLEKYLKASGNYTIYVKGAITVNSMISVLVKNKSIYGLPGSYLYNPNRTSSESGILYFKPGSDNIIMRNMTFKSAGAYDVDGNDNFCIDKTTNIWVDHCDFQDGVDGNFDCKNSSDYVCVTWCRFHYLIPPKAGGSGGANDHRYTDLWGSSDSKTTDAGHLNTTFMYCWWGEGCVERMPRVRFGKVHILNCLYNSTSSNYCVGAGNNSSIYVEKTAFIGVQDPYKNYSSSSDPGYLTFDDCLFTNCKTQNGNTKGTGKAFTPSTYYSLTGIDKSLVESVVSDAKTGAGATLNVVECKGVVVDESTSTGGTTEEEKTAVLTKTGIGSSSQEVVVGNAISSFGYIYENATGATVTGLPKGVDATVNTNDNTITISGTPTEIGSFKFSVATTGATTNATKTGTINVVDKKTEGGEEEGGDTDIDVKDPDMICHFTDLIPSSSFYVISGNYSNSKGSATVNGTVYTDCLKLESSTSVSFNTTKPATLKLVFGETETPSIKLNDVKSSALSNVKVDGNVITISGLEAGSYTLAKDGSANLFYIATVYDSETSIEEAVSESKRQDNRTYDMNGRAVRNIESNKVYISNGSKFMINK